MKTLTAFLAQQSIGILQAASAVTFFDPHTNQGAFGNLGVLITTQLALAAAKGFVARLNSHSDPEGNPLAEVSSGKYVTAK